MSFLDQLLQSHGDVIADSLVRHLELSRDESLGVVSKTVPLVLGGLARQAQTRGPEAVARILEEHADASALTDTSGFLDRRAESEDVLGGLGSLVGGGLLSGKGGLGSLFGGSIAKMAVGALAGYLNVNTTQASKVLPMLVPLIMTLLGRQAAEDQSGLPGLMQLLEQEGDIGALEELASKVLGGAGFLGGLLRGNS